MSATPKRAGRTPRPGARFLSQILAENVRATRSLQRLNQADLADRMNHLGSEWSRVTVGEVEQARRAVNVDELGQLAVALDVTIGQLLDPTGLDHQRTEDVDLGIRDQTDVEVVPAWSAHAWLRDRIVIGGFSGRMFNLRLRPAPEFQPQAQRAINRLVGPSLGLRLLDRSVEVVEDAGPYTAVQFARLQESEP